MNKRVIMELDDCIKTRRSIRRFLDKAVLNSLVAQIINAGIWAPSAGNIQDKEFIIVRSKKKKKEIIDACHNQYWIDTADLILVLYADPKKTEVYYGPRASEYACLSAGCCAENMMLKAHDLGLSSCFVGLFDEVMIKRALSIPEASKVYAVIPIGYPAEKPPAPRRSEIQNVTYFEKHGEKFKEKDFIKY